MENAVIIGGGASGMFASVFLAKRGFQVTLLEQNEKLGKKLFITGKGRCNFTNSCTPEEFMKHIESNPKFLYSAYAAFSAQDMIRTLEEWGLKIKIERGNRAFPESDHAYDVTDTLKKQMKKLNVNVLLKTKAEGIITSAVADPDGADSPKNGSCVSGVRIRDGVLPADRVLIATGGLSYPSTGSTGDGFRFAKDLGLAVTELYPSLVSIACEDDFCADLQGLSLKNVELSVKSGKKELFREFGEMMFTHDGITGPIVLSASSAAGPFIGRKTLSAAIDLKPAVSTEKLDAHLLRLLDENANKDILNAVRPLYPARLAPVILSLAEIDPAKKVHDLSRTERQRIVERTKEMPVHLKELHGFEEAVITKGGVSVREINPKTMEAKKIRGLYFIGEVLDVDGLTGGFNLQIAWSTAYAAANA